MFWNYLLILFHLFLLFNYVLHLKQNYILVINYCYLTWEKATFSHFVSVVHIPLKVTLPCVNMGLSWNATQLIIPVSFVEPVAREHNWNPAVLTDSAHTAEGEWTSDDWSSWLNDTNTRTWNALGKERHQWQFADDNSTLDYEQSLFFLNPSKRKWPRAWLKERDCHPRFSRASGGFDARARVKSSRSIWRGKESNSTPNPPIPDPIPRIKDFLAYFYCQNPLAFFFHLVWFCLKTHAS